MVAAADSKLNDAEVLEMERSACPTCGSCSGMFTANSMNCLTEALGLALPGNGSVLATHADRKGLFLQAARTVVEIARRYYEQDDASVLPRSVASFEAFENAMMLDIAMGGSTNTVLHLLAAAHEAEVNFTMKDIDRLSRRIPQLCKVAPSVSDVHMEDVHRAGGIMAILGELDRAGHLHPRPADGPRADAWVRRSTAGTSSAPTSQTSCASSGSARRHPDARSPSARTGAGTSSTSTATTGVIRNAEHAFSKDGGLAVLYGNLAEDGCIVKTAGVDDSILKFSGPARIFESQDAAVEAILADAGQGRRRGRDPL